MRKNIKMLLCTGLCAVSVVGMSMIGYADTDETQASEEGRPPMDDGSVMAKVASVDDDTLVVYLAETPEMGEAPAEGETPPERPEGETLAEGETPPERPEGETLAEGETPPEKPEGETGEDGERPEGGGRGGFAMNFSEETTTLTITSSTVITVGMDQTEADVSDIEVDDMVRLVLDGTEVTSISVMDMGEGAPAQTEAE